MKIKTRYEDAVSPVIGVMLMLVVTVVIAAVVVGFSTGLAGDTGSTPMAMFEVAYVNTAMGESGEEVTSIGIRHKGGDEISLENLMLNLKISGTNINDGISHSLKATDTRYELEGVEYNENDFNIKYAEYESYYNDALNDNMWMVDAGWITLDQAKEQALFQMNTMYPNGAPKKEDFKIVKQSQKSALTVLGQEENGAKAIVSTGDIIHVVAYEGSEKGWNSIIPTGGAIIWTLSYIPTNGVIAKGEFAGMEM